MGGRGKKAWKRGQHQALADPGFKGWTEEECLTVELEKTTTEQKDKRAGVTEARQKEFLERGCCPLDLTGPARACVPRTWCFCEVEPSRGREHALKGHCKISAHLLSHFKIPGNKSQA